MRSCIIGGVKVLVIIITTVLLFELSYRFYVIDFYEAELMALNQPLTETEKNGSTVLLLGDSFTANAESYVAQLRNELPYTFVNSAVSGTGIFEASFMASSRVNRFKPNIVVYQIYVGNDFLDIRHRPTSEISFIRRIYHEVSDHIRVFKFINYRFGQVRANVYQDLEIGTSDQKTVFSIERYSPRQKMIFREEPFYLENSLELKNERENDAKILVTKLKALESGLNKETEMILVIIPHCAQVNATYLERMRLLGSESEVKSKMFYEIIRKEFPELTIVDVLPNFQRTDYEGNRLYLENDPHLSHIGQTELAKIIRPYLEAELIAR
ncbi:MAG: hypothetical protein ACJATE_000122 [Bacteroidia bacterium]|jgi:hypothetical protein